MSETIDQEITPGAAPGTVIALDDITDAITGAVMTAPAEIAAPPQRLAPLWRNRDYMLLWSGQTISSLGSGVSGIVFPLLILAITHSAAAAGIAGALNTLPYVLFSLPAGALVDRWDRKRVMIICDAG